jgi:hypothetical protein
MIDDPIPEKEGVYPTMKPHTMNLTLRDLPADLVLGLIRKAANEKTPLSSLLLPFLEEAASSNPTHYINSCSGQAESLEDLRKSIRTSNRYGKISHKR